MRGQDQESRVLYELCSLILSILRCPPLPISHSNSSSAVESSVSSSRRPIGTTTMTQISPAGLASLFLGISMALMLCGSITFVIGFMLMPWVLGLVMILYFVGIVSNLSVLGRAFFFPAAPPRKDISVPVVPGISQYRTLPKRHVDDLIRAGSP